MKITVLSDTHMPRMSKQLPAPLLQDLQDADLIFHAGDWTDIGIYEELQSMGKVHGVYGNTDLAMIRGILPESTIVEAGGRRFGIVHGHVGKGSTEDNALDTFKGEQLDCIIFGHSHIPVLKKAGDCLLFNPGSPTDKRRQPQFSHGVILVDGQMDIKHVFYDSKV
ncbi:metallophosphoesterase [Neobacillus mesonae]|nr:metallophosphoesterase [Neobacillus mesonae]